jgi:hypothetical protein
MRLVPVLALLIAGAAHAADTPEQEATVTVANQHMVLSVLSAMYHCENGQWPLSVADLRTFKESEKITLPVEANWALLESADFSVEIAENIQAHSTPGIIPSASAVSSKNSSPGCKNGNLEVNAEMHIGE